ncbi:Alpha/Beta hydrolase protein [Phaeosphaeriaceae sp. PMI808]|nr:Alpha/Beta hydrolase protein [Phaeosphaeriaceae sp. PMI808]
MHLHGTTSTAATLALNTLHSITALSVASIGCGKQPPVGLVSGGASINLTLHSANGGGNRRYLLYLPEKYSNDKPLPLIIALHAFTQTTKSMEDMTRFSYADTNNQNIAVYPEGINNVWLGDPGAPNSSVIDDRPFINDLLDEIESTICIDKRRIYTTGFSNGGGLSALLSCYPPTVNRVAAFSGVSAAYYTKKSLGYPLFEKEACSIGDRSPPIPFLDIHGDSDGVIAYDGNNSRFDIDQNGIPDPDTLPIPQWLADMATRNGCPAPANYTVGNHLATGDVVNASSWLENGTIQMMAWTCNEQQDVVKGIYVKGLGHGWPSTVALGGIYEELRRGPTSWNASTLLTNWFSQWSLPDVRNGL